MSTIASKKVTTATKPGVPVLPHKTVNDSKFIVSYVRNNVIMKTEWHDDNHKTGAKAKNTDQTNVANKNKWQAR